MNTMDKFIIRGKLTAGRVKNGASAVLKKMKTKAQGDETLVVKVMLIVIAVALGLMFRNQIGEIIQNLLGNAKTQIDGMFSEFGTTSGTVTGGSGAVSSGATSVITE
jgi:hypothetical protein